MGRERENNGEAAQVSCATSKPQGAWSHWQSDHLCLNIFRAVHLTPHPVTMHSLQILALCPKSFLCLSHPPDPRVRTRHPTRTCHHCLCNWILDNLPYQLFYTSTLVVFSLLHPRFIPRTMLHTTAQRRSSVVSHARSPWKPTLTISTSLAPYLSTPIPTILAPHPIQHTQTLNWLLLHMDIGLTSQSPVGKNSSPVGETFSQLKCLCHVADLLTSRFWIVVPLLKASGLEPIWCVWNPAQALWKSGHPVKAIRTHLKGKEGRLRDNLMGRRVDLSARTAITSDLNLKLDEVGIPRSIVMNLTYLEQGLWFALPLFSHLLSSSVAPHNITHLQELVCNGPTTYPGTRCVVHDTGECMDLHYNSCANPFIQYGWIIERHWDGEYVSLTA